MATVLKPDPFNAVLLTSQPVVLSPEQENYIREILYTSCSDSRFAQKAWVAIHRVLTGLPVVPPVVQSLNPDTVAIGASSFDLRVLGTGFTSSSLIIFNGFEEPTTFVSQNEVSTGVDMTVWLAPAVVPVAVETDGVMSDSKSFTFTEAGARRDAKMPPMEKKKEEEKEEKFREEKAEKAHKMGEK